jgi:hypothetical protein
VIGAKGHRCVTHMCDPVKAIPKRAELMVCCMWHDGCTVLNGAACTDPKLNRHRRLGAATPQTLVASLLDCVHGLGGGCRL